MTHAQFRACAHHGERTMDSFFKGGILWLMGVPVIGILAAWGLGWI